MPSDIKCHKVCQYGYQKNRLGAKHLPSYFQDEDADGGLVNSRMYSREASYFTGKNLHEAARRDLAFGES